MPEDSDHEQEPNTDEEKQDRMMSRLDGVSGSVDPEEETPGGPDEPQSQQSTDTGTQNEAESRTDDESSSSSQPISIRTIWDNHSFYLPDDISDPLGSQFKKLDWQLSDEYGLDIKKTRHYYPLIAELGLAQLQEMDHDEVRERIEEIEPEDDYFD